MYKYILAITLLFINFSTFANGKNENTSKTFSAKSIKDLANNIDNVTDSEKVEQVCIWIAHNIAWDTKSFNDKEKLKFKSSAEVLKTKVAKPEEYARLLKDICTVLDINAMVILGYEKDELYENGAGFYKPNHAWNAIMINKKWTLFDVYNAAGDVSMELSWWKKQIQKLNKKKVYNSSKFIFKYNYQPEYLFQNPEEAMLTKVPIDPLWQLSDTILPLAIFEKSEKDIKEFLEKYSHPKLFSLKLSELCKLSDDAYTTECADRTYAYNPRYTEMKAHKLIALANENLKKLKDINNKDEAKIVVLQSKNDYSAAKDILGNQKKEINKEYSELRKVNNEKKLDIGKYKQSFTTVNTKHISKLGTRINATKAKGESIVNDTKSKLKNTIHVNANSLATIKTMQPEKNASTQETNILNDSISARNNAVRLLNYEIATQEAFIDKSKYNKDQITDSMNYYIKLSTQAFNKEILARSKKQDSFDDSVKAIHSALYYYKIVKLDSLQNMYFENYDTIIVSYNAIKMANKNIMEINKKTIQDIEIFKKTYITNNSFYNTYTSNVDEYKVTEKNYANNNINLLNFMKNESKNMQQMKEIYTNQNAYFDKLNINEEGRKDLVKKVLVKEEEIEKKHNEQKKEMIKKEKEKLDKMFEGIKNKRISKN